MLERAGKRALRVSIAVSIVAAIVLGSNAQAQTPAPLPIQAYERLMQPINTYLTIPYLYQKADFFGGIDMAKATSFAWMGATYAPMGTLVEDGWRVRLMGGAGRYSYQTSFVPGGINDATAFSAELLGGYRKTFDNLFGNKLYVGAFAGLHYEDQILVWSDPFNPARGSEAGIKATLELYSRVQERFIASAFGSTSTVHNKYYVKTSLLYEFTEMWALGGEAATMGDARYYEHRAGAAATLTWRKKVISLSAGVLENSGRGDGTYLNLSVYSPF
jgi:hypothetical protein